MKNTIGAGDWHSFNALWILMVLPSASSVCEINLYVSDRGISSLVYLG